MQRCGCRAVIILLLLSPHAVGFVILPSIVFYVAYCILLRNQSKWVRDGDKFIKYSLVRVAAILHISYTGCTGLMLCDSLELALWYCSERYIYLLN